MLRLVTDRLRAELAAAPQDTLGSVLRGHDGLHESSVLAPAFREDPLLAVVAGICWPLECLLGATARVGGALDRPALCQGEIKFSFLIGELAVDTSRALVTPSGGSASL